MDDIDRHLVAVLRSDARASYAQLARHVGLSAPSVQERVRRLERRGVLTGFHAVVDPVLVGLGVTALVSIHQADYAEQDDVAARLAGVPEVEDCWLVAGEEAFVVKVRVADVTALEGTIAALRRLEGVSRTQTTVVMSTRWEGRVVPLPPVAPIAAPPATGLQDNDPAALPASASNEPAADEPRADEPAEDGPAEDESATEARAS